MDQKRRVTISKFLSKHLRHQPDALGLTLDEGGWVNIADLLDACARHGLPITRDQLEEVVRTSDKQRFAIDDTNTRIRANQGHSTPVELQLEPLDPPAVLYHGTAKKNATVILAFGLLKMKRHHVHLSHEIDTARAVGKRHGEPIIFAIDCASMHARGHVFYRSANGVWLTDQVPAEFLTLIDEI
jgi:putative RNA 2'-phosphotransferase